MAEIGLLKRGLRDPRIMCQQSVFDYVMLFSEDEGVRISTDEEDEHNAWICSWTLLGQSRSGMWVDSFLEDEGLARTALSCHLSVNLLCQEMSDGCWFEDCRKEGHE